MAESPLYGEESDIAHKTKYGIILFSVNLIFFIVISMALCVLWLWFIPLSIRAVEVRRGQKRMTTALFPGVTRQGRVGLENELFYRLASVHA